MLNNYLKIALKVLLRRKFFTFISLFGIATTLVVLTVSVAVLDHFFGPQSPEIRNDRTLTVLGTRLDHEHGYSLRRYGAYSFLDRYVRTLPDVERVSLHAWPETGVSYVNGEIIRSSVKRTDGAFWEIMEFDFLEGGPFHENDNREARFVAVITESTRRRFFGDQSAIGRSIEMDGQRFRVVGTVKDISWLRRLTYADVWTPITTSKTEDYLDDQLQGGFVASILAFDRSDFPEIKAEFQSRLQHVQLPSGFVHFSTSAGTHFESVYRDLVDDHYAAHPEVLLLGLLGAALLFMTLPAVNLVNINISRILERSSEIGVRRSFGASSRTLVGQFLTENVVLCLIGGVAGYLISQVVLDVITSSGVIPHAEISLNLRVFGYGLLLILMFAVVSGVYPAWRMSRLHPVEALKERAL